ncbi:MAG TPA: aldehyde dehydrogenase family protein [Candidatus Polarisedimenticolia bacterium]|nr:aldehyde dehydrogenase family protein [Candidatus Polarisedimenticolia bacterium]
MASPTVFGNYIKGEWAAAASGRTFENINPADSSERIGTFAASEEQDVRRAVDAAAAAYDGWRLTPAPRRAEILFKAGEILQQRKEQLARDMTREMGKVLKETRGDVQEAIDTAFYAAGEGRRLFGQTVPAELPDKFALSIRVPVGVCAMITPWNFPMAIPSWKILPALVCGNTMVIKPATDTPLSVVHFIQALHDAGVPPGVVNMVTGNGAGVGEPLMRSDGVRLVSFTGSTETGRRVAMACADTYKKCSLEMGGKNAMILLEDADLDLAVEAALWGAFGTTGQRCTATSRVLADRRVAGAFAERMTARARALRVGNGLDEATEMGPCVNEAQRRTVESYVAIGRQEGARLLTGGERLTGGAHDRGHFFQPTIFADVKPAMRIATEEIFGPVLSIIPVDGLDEAIRVANAVQYGLSGAIFTRDVNKAFKAMRDVEAGIFYVNSSTIGAEVQLPFGGVKKTGNGHREAGTTVLDIFTEWKSVYVDFSGRLQKAQIDRTDV